MHSVQKFLDSDYAYFYGSSSFDNEFIELKELVLESW